MRESEAPIASPATSSLDNRSGNVDSAPDVPVAWQGFHTRLCRDRGDPYGRPVRVRYGHAEELGSPQAVAAWLNQVVFAHSISRTVCLTGGGRLCRGETADTEVRTRLWRQHMYDARAGRQIRVVAREGDQAIEFIVCPVWTERSASDRNG